MLKDKIGSTWEDVVAMQEDLECELEGVVYFGDIRSIPFSSAEEIEIYNEQESYMLKFLKTEDVVKLLGVY